MRLDEKPRYITLPNGLPVYVDYEDFNLLSTYNWYYDKGYAKTHPGTFMHRLIMKAGKNDKVDHINGNKLDNRKDNLRLTTHAQNMKNMRKHRDNTSGFKGIYWHKGNKKYHAKITVDGKYIHIGTFNDPVEAAKAYDAKAIELHGSFANINFTPLNLGQRLYTHKEMIDKIKEFGKRVYPNTIAGAVEYEYQKPYNDAVMEMRAQIDKELSELENA